ncbi:protein-export chaperone SecB [Loktanella sp. IMCC34160]|uniref:protein-export chaperone SecB n=1 Tax=Rhodobacterales TaxID=204455 RepID=UPI00101D03ED|nr:protein-export chaperone SecB [Loktanella sp. IMCC34160]RYG91320.1 protein-export chaperone SecB [Loktanella sp. IMCC34160]
MAENETAGAAPTAEQPKVTSKILAQYVRDMSFENILAQKGAQGEVQPQLAVKVNLDARKRGENQYEVITKLTVTSNNKSDQSPLFLLEMEYAGLFHIDGLPEEQLHPYLLIECPRMTFPFLRRVVSDVTRDGGFPPVNLDTIDFLALYRQELARRVEEQKAKAN